MGENLSTRQWVFLVAVVVFIVAGTARAWGLLILAAVVGVGAVFAPSRPGRERGQEFAAAEQTPDRSDYAELDVETIFQEARAKYLAGLEVERLRQQRHPGQLDPDVAAALAMLRARDLRESERAAPPQSVPDLRESERAAGPRPLTLAEYFGTEESAASCTLDDGGAISSPPAPTTP
jgi:hypothetical protein